MTVVSLTEHIDQHYDGFATKDQLKATYAVYIQKNTPEALRDLLAHALGIYGLLRGANQRDMLLSDLSHSDMPNETPQATWAVALTLVRSKRQKGDGTNTTGFMRSKDVFECPVWFLSSYLFSR